MSRPLAAHVRRRLLDQVARDVIRARALLDGSMGLMHDCQAGHPRAARYDGHDGQEAKLWCFEHEQDRNRCLLDGRSCDGIPVGTGDSTGEAAVSPDRAAAAMATVDRAITSLSGAAASLADEVVRWSPPKTGIARPDRTAPTAPDGWCQSCWRIQKHEPIGVRPNGVPFYRSYCRFCGSYRGANGGELPPIELLKIHHSASPRIYDRDIVRARRRGKGTTA